MSLKTFVQILIGILLLGYISIGVYLEDYNERQTILGAPTSRLERTLLAETDDRYFIGTTTPANLRYKALYIGTGTSTAANGFNISAGCFAINNVCIGGDVFPAGTNGQVLALANGTPTWVATTTFNAVVGQVTLAYADGNVTCPRASIAAGGCITNGEYNIFNAKVGTPGSADVGALAYFTTPGSGSNITSVATTTANCAGSVTCAQFIVIGPSPITITGSGGSSGLATSSPIADSNVLVYSSVGAGSAYGVATGTVTAGVGISLDSSVRSVIGGALQITNSSPLSGLIANFPFSFSNPTLTWLGLSTTTNSGMTQGNLYVGSGGILQTSASSSIFGFTPLNPTRNLTVAGTANQVSVSGGTQDLSADRTWTASLPNHVIFPFSFQATESTTTYATTSVFAITGTGTSTFAGGVNLTSGCFSIGNVCVGGSSSVDPYEIATTSDIAVSQVAYITKVGGRTTIGSVATGTISSANTALTVTPARYVLGGDVTFTISTTSNAMFSGTAGQVLAFTNNGWVGVGTTTFSSGLAYANGNVTNTLTAGDGLTRTVDDIDCDTASLTVFGCLSTTWFDIFNNKVSSTSLSGASVISYTSGTGVITTTGGTFGAGNYVFPAELTVTSSSTFANVFAQNATTSGYLSVLGTATSTFRGNGINLSAGCFAINNVCIGGTTASWPFTPATHWGQAVQSTTTALFLQATPYSLFASSTAQFTNATASQITVADKTWLTTLTSALLLTGADGLVAEYAGSTCGANTFAQALSALGVVTCDNVDLATADVTGILPLANGGTNKALTASNGAFVYSDADSFELSSIGTAGRAVLSGGAGAPTFFNPTIGSVIFGGLNGILQQDNANFFWDDSNNRLGLGTSTPASSLDVFSTATTTITIDSNGALKGGCIKIKDSDGVGYTYIRANNGTLFSSTITCQ